MSTESSPVAPKKTTRGYVIGGVLIVLGVLMTIERGLFAGFIFGTTAWGNVGFNERDVAQIKATAIVGLCNSCRRRLQSNFIVQTAIRSFVRIVQTVSRYSSDCPSLEPRFPPFPPVPTILQTLESVGYTR